MKFIVSDKHLHKKKKSSNKQTNFTPKETRKGRTKPKISRMKKKNQSGSKQNGE